MAGRARTAGVVPEYLRGGRLEYILRESPWSRRPLRVSAGAFRAAGVPLPDDPAQLNIYQLHGRRGLPWSPAIDRHVGHRGAELDGRGEVGCIDCDASRAGNGLAELHALAAAHGTVLDLSGAVVVPTPGNGDHEPGVHIWWSLPAPVKFGPLARHPAIEVKSRATCPNSPRYPVTSEPAAGLAPIPRWLAVEAGPPVTALSGRDCYSQLEVTRGRPAERLAGLVACLLEAEDGRNGLLFWCGARCGEMIRAGQLERDIAETALLAAATECGYVARHGTGNALATIRSGFRAAAAA